MKKLFYFLTILGIVFTACENGGGVEDENKVTPFVPEISITPTTLNFSCNGGERAVDIIANFEYEVTERASWITIEQTDEGLLVVVDENKNTAERSAFISITNSQYDITKTIDVVQEAWVPKIDIAQQNIEVEFEPAEYEVAVTSPYSWEATTKNDWIEVKTETGIAGEEVLKFSVKRNEEMQERKGTITIKNSNYNLVVELYVTQKAFVPELTIEPESLSFAVEGGTQEIAITANFEYTYTTDGDWVVLHKTTNGLEVTVQNAVAFENRIAEIIVLSDRYEVSKKVCVSQNALSKDSTNVIFYTSKDGEIVVPYKTDIFGANIMSNTYNNGMGLIFFDAPVTSIGYGAFYNRSGLTSVTIPSSVTEIGEYAFRECSNLTSVTIPNSVTSIGESAFDDCSSLTGVYISDLSAWCKIDFGNSDANPLDYAKKLYLNDTEVTELTIPSDVAVIKSYAFSSCTSLTSVTIPDSVTSIGDRAFDNCDNLTGVIIGNGVTSIGNYTFQDCKSLTNITIGNGINSIGYGAFSNCGGLTSVTIPDGVTSIRSSAFEYCRKLIGVKIGNSVTTIGTEAFYECSSLTSVTIPDSVTSIGAEAFRGCRKIVSVTIGKGVTSIGRGAFLDCSGELIIKSKIIDTDYTSDSYPMYSEKGWLDGSKFTKLTIDENIEKIGDYALYNCGTITSVTVPKNITLIGNYAFEGCANLKKVEISDLSTWCKINFKNSAACPLHNGAELYVNGEKAVKITIPSDISKIEHYAFYHCMSLEEVTISDNVTYISNSAFSQCSNLSKVTIGRGVETIYNHAFSYCNTLKSISIPANVKNLGGSLFKNCKALESATIESNIQTLPQSIFNGCSALTNVVIPNSITEIGSYAFQNCSCLPNIIIPERVTSIGKCAFQGCTGELIVKSKIIETDYYPSDYPIYSEEGWLYGSRFIKLTIDENVERIGNYVFYKCVSLTDVTIGNGINSIGYGAFSNCSGLTSVTIPSSVTEIKEYAFRECSNLTSVIIPNSVTSIGKESFSGCNSLNSVTIPNSVTSIGNKAFYGCTGELVINNKILLETDYTSSNYPIYSSTGWLYGSMFTKLTIGNDITKIGARAFQGCSNLTSVTIPDSITSIGESAFSDCNSLNGLYISDLSAWCKIDFGNWSANPLGYAKKLYLNDTEVTELTIPSDVAVIKSYAFDSCDSLKSVTIPDSVTSIGNSAFGSCHSLTSVTIGNSVTSIGEDAFTNCEHLTSVIIGNGVTSIGGGAFYYCTSLTSVTIPDSVTSIGNVAFGSCHSLTSVTIGNSVTSIGNSAFGYCRKLIGVKIGNSVTTIGTEAFYECSSLISVTIPDSVTSIGREAFMYCTSLTSVTIGNSVTSIGQSAFEYCRNLINVYCKPIIPPTGGSSMFNGIASGRKIYVPHNSVSAYKTATYWSEYASSIVGYDFE